MNKTLEILDKQLVFDIISPINKSTKCIELKNENTKFSFLFKIKTSARQRYIVKPNYGIILPGKVFSVSITCTNLSYEDALKPVEDKFVIYALMCPPSITTRTQIDEYIQQNKQTCLKFNIISTVRFDPTWAEIRPSSFPSLASNKKTEMMNMSDEHLTLKSDLFESAISGSFEKYPSMISGEIQNQSNQKSTEPTIKFSDKFDASNVKKADNQDQSDYSKEINLKSNIGVPKTLNDEFFSKANKMKFSGDLKHKYEIKENESNESKIEEKKPKVKIEPGDSHLFFHIWELLLVFILGTIFGAFLNGK